MSDDTTLPPTDDDALQNALEEVARLKDMAARAQADLQNAKARMQKEAADIRVFAVQGLIEQLLPTIDNFRRAFEHLPEDLKTHEWVKGVQAMEQQLLRDLEGAGLKSIEALGLQADSSRHEVIQTVPGPMHTVMQVLESGYELNGKVIKPAKVTVGNGEGN